MTKRHSASGLEKGLTVAATGMIHLNGNLLCAVDVETTGADPKKQDIIQICILPLDANIKPRKDIIPFYMFIQPRRPENIDWQAMSVNQFEMAKIQLEGIDPFRAVDLLEEWFEKLKLGNNKRLSPLAQNWPFDRDFIMEWLGPKMYSYIFDGRYRDTMAAALYVNDKSLFMGESFPYPIVNLSALANAVHAEQDRAHDAMSDCMTTAEVYRKMLMGLI